MNVPCWFRYPSGFCFWCCLCIFVLQICVHHVYWCSHQDLKKIIEGERARIRVIKQSLGNAYSHREVLLPVHQAALLDDIFPRLLLNISMSVPRRLPRDMPGSQREFWLSSLKMLSNWRIYRNGRSTPVLSKRRYLVLSLLDWRL